MIWLAAPLWLLGLALGPLIWWLHRASGHGRALPVPSLLLFRDAAAPRTGGARAPRADPVWWRRAAIAILLVLALAGPALERPAHEVTVWLDDSPSMATRESGGTRMALAIEALRGALPLAGSDRVVLRSLTAPGVFYRLGGALPAIRAGEPHAPPSVALRGGTAHWLVTDGTSPELEAWARSGALDRVIHVGHETENAGLANLAVRTRLDDPARLDGTVRVLNAGRHGAHRELRVHAAARLFLDLALDLAPGEARTVDFTLPRSAADRGEALEAELTPADALPDDDRLVLPAAVLRARRVRLGSACPDALRNAIAANPDLTQVAADTPADLAISCGEAAQPPSTPPAAVTPPLLVLVERPQSALAALRDGAWLEPARRALSERALPRTLLARGELEAHEPGDEPLLEAGGHVLVLRRAGLSRRLESTLDLGAATIAAAPQYPLLVGELLELASGESLIARVARDSRDPQSIAIAAAPEGNAIAVARNPARRMPPTAWPLAPELLALAALLLLWDLAESLRATITLARARSDAGAAP